MEKIVFDYSRVKEVGAHELEYLVPSIQQAHDALQGKTGPGHEFLGWMDLPESFPQEELDRLSRVAERVREQAEVLVVIGIGGSYLGARAALEMLTKPFDAFRGKSKTGYPQVIFAGHQLSSAYLHDLLDYISDKEVVLNVISKSGTTTEPAIAFRVLRAFMEQRYGKEEARKRIIATTDKDKGALRTLATEEDYDTFVIPDDVGGRYSVLTPVGLFPLCVAGVDIQEMLAGASYAKEAYSVPQWENNPAYQYAALRTLLSRKGKVVEILVGYEPALTFFAEWWKQLFGESDGKDHKGLFPASVNFTTDLHSLGQFIQDGTRMLFETNLLVAEPAVKFPIPFDASNKDGLNFLSEKDLALVNQKAFEGTLLAHADGGVPNLIITVPKLNAYWFGALSYFFEKACAMGGYLLGINPFDQPGVEAYKRNMFALLGKPGFEKEKEILEKRLKG